jgi:NitT/TauT family transport system ATP-binding protein
MIWKLPILTSLCQSMKTSLLEAVNIHHAFGTTEALADVSLALERETFTCLVGPSGSGKSTLLRMFAGLLHPSHGQILLHGEPLLKPQRALSLVFQDANLMPWRTVYQNLVLPLEIEGQPRSEQRTRADNLLAMLGLSDFKNAYPAALSGGMAQRLAIGRALIHDPEVLLLDEPFGALDALTREQVSEELLKIWAQTRKTVLMITHSIQEAILLADRVVVMSPRPGQIIQEIPVDLPRPRSLAIVTQPEFVALEAKVRAALKR